MTNRIRRMIEGFEPIDARDLNKLVDMNEEPSAEYYDVGYVYPQVFQYIEHVITRVYNESRIRWKRTMSIRMTLLFLNKLTQQNVKLSKLVLIWKRY